MAGRYNDNEPVSIYDAVMDEEFDEYEDETELPFPKVVFIIIINEFCERFSYYVLRGTLTLYLRNKLDYTEYNSLVVFHLFVFFSCLFPLIGAIFADGYLGRFKTIVYFSLVHAFGNLLLAISTIPELRVAAEALCIVSLMLVAIGTGGIKPCVSALGGDQFILPMQKQQLEMFFSFFYFAISCGSVLSTIITPLFRHKVHCMGEESCYPLAFGFPAGLMILAAILFIAAKKHYYIFPPPGRSITWEWLKCVAYSAKKSIGAKDKQTHWVHRSIGKYKEKFVFDVQKTLSILLLFTPLPMFWALYEQQASSWIFQGTRMNGRITTVEILPDQMQFLNTILILVFIPLFDYFLYPFLSDFNMLTKPLQRMCCGGFLAAIAFLIAGGVSYTIENTFPAAPARGEVDIRMFNTLKCHMRAYFHPINRTEYVAFLETNKVTIEFDKDKPILSIKVYGCESRVLRPIVGLNVTEEETYFCLLSFKGFHCGPDNIEKDKNGHPKIRTLVDRPRPNVKVIYKEVRGHRKMVVNSTDINYNMLPRGGKYFVGDDFNTKFNYKMGGVFVTTVRLHRAHIEDYKIHTIVTPNYIHILWQLPQIILITAAEVLICPTALRFAYTQAPRSMKSFVTSIYLLTEAFGNLIVVIFAVTKPFKLQSYLFFLFGVMMLITTAIFTYLAIRYKYVELDIGEELEEEEEEEEDYF